MTTFTFKKILTFTALASAVALTGCQKEELEEDQFIQPEAIETTSNEQIIEGQYIVVFKDGASTINTYDESLDKQLISATIRQAVMSKAAIGDEAIQETYTGAVKGFAARLSSSQLQELRKSPEIAYIEPDRMICLNAASMTSIAPSSTAGKITREHWEKVSGSTVSSIPLTSAPTSTSELMNFEAPSNIGNNYGARVRGYVTAPVSGQYTFWIAGDNSCELWLSSSKDPANKLKIAYVSGHTGSRQWTKYASQKSARISLEAGEKYYIEALHKEGGGNDNLAVGWQLPDGMFERPIPGQRLSAYDINTNETGDNSFKTISPLAGETVPWSVDKVGYGDGTGKTVWVVDTGVKTDHPDLTVDVNRSKSFVYGVSSVEDGHGHGTSVAGVIAARNNGSGLIGVAAGATVVALRVFDDAGRGTMSRVISAVLHAGAYGKAGDVVNMSLGGGVSLTLDNAVKSAASKGILFALAAGNSAVDCDRTSPARVNAANVYTVSAMDRYDRLWVRSNHGLTIDFSAPGVGVPSINKAGTISNCSGTSFAAPHVAGILLLRGKIYTNGKIKGDRDSQPDPIASVK